MVTGKKELGWADREPTDSTGRRRPLAGRSLPVGPKELRNIKDYSKSLQGMIARAQVRYMTMEEIAYGILRQAILEGTLAPGEVLRQEELAAELRMSRLPVRSALRQLSADGLVEIVPHRGAVVRVHTRAEIHQIFATRRLLEGYLLREAMSKQTVDRLSRLEELGRKLERRLPPDEFMEVSTAFADELYRPAGNDLMLTLVQRLRSDVGRYWLDVRGVHEAHQGTRRADLIAFLRARDLEGALRWLNDHLTEVEQSAVVALNGLANGADGD